MKKLMILVLLLGGGIGVYYSINGQLPWTAATDEEREVAQLRETVRVAFRQFQQAGRAAGLSGIDTTNTAWDCASKLEQAEKELAVLRPRLKSARAKKAAANLIDEIASDKQQMR